MNTQLIFSILAAIILIASLVTMFLSPASGSPAVVRRRTIASYTFILGLALLIISWMAGFSSGTR